MSISVDTQREPICNNRAATGMTCRIIGGIGGIGGNVQAVGMDPVWNGLVGVLVFISTSFALVISFTS